MFKQNIKLPFLFILISFFVIGCSNDSNENEERQMEEEDNNQEETEKDNDTSESASSTHIEHQEGLKLGETGTVVDNNKSYEITLNSVEYLANVGGLEASSDIYAVVHLTVKNIDDHSFDAKDIYGPGFGKQHELTATLNPALLDYPDKIEEALFESLLEGEIAPGEEITGVHVFDIEKNEDYVLAFGGSGAQIITYAQWEIADSEIES